MNPPYGERISTPNLLGTYKMIGERLKHQFMGNEAWILSYREECFREIGLKPSIKIPVYNGSLECEFRRYQMFDGKLNDFRAEVASLKRKTKSVKWHRNIASRRIATSRNDSTKQRKTKKATYALSPSIALNTTSL